MSVAHHGFVAACSSESDIEETAEEKEEEEGEGVSMGVAVPRPKLKTWKGTLLPGGEKVLLFNLTYQDRGVLPHQVRKRSSLRFVEIPSSSKEYNKEYDLKTAISLLKQTTTTKFEQIVEAHFCLRIDPKYGDQQLQATVNLPKGTGDTVKVAVLTQCEKFDEAKNAGADLVGGEDLIERIKGGFTEFDKLITSPDMMPKVACLNYILGIRGLMPNPKAGTLTSNIPQAVAEFKQGKIAYKADKTGNVHIPFGKADFPEEDLLVNLVAAAQSVEANKPPGAKAVYWKTAHICSRRGPSVRLSIRHLLNYRLPSDL